MKKTGTIPEIIKELEEIHKKNKKEKVYNLFFSEKLTKQIRTLRQNNMFQGLFTEIGNHLGKEKDDIKDNFLKGLFGVRKNKLGIFTSEVAIEPHTSKLDKQQAIKLINGIIAFIEKYGVPCKYTSTDFKNLIDSYNE